jgi:hypothetical protein
MQYARRLIDENWEAIERVAEALQAGGKLTGDEVAALIKGRSTHKGYSQSSSSALATPASNALLNLDDLHHFEVAREHAKAQIMVPPSGRSRGWITESPGGGGS